jgi:phage terminase small subunit
LVIDMAGKPKLHVVPKTANAPPMPLGKHGQKLWAQIHSEYVIDDTASRMSLALACQQLDRAEALRQLVDQEGEVITTRTGKRAHPALKPEQTARSFVVRTLARLGLTDQPLNKPGRPPTVTTWIPLDDA